MACVVVANLIYHACCPATEPPRGHTCVCFFLISTLCFWGMSLYSGVSFVFSRNVFVFFCIHFVFLRNIFAFWCYACFFKNVLRLLWKRTASLWTRTACCPDITSEYRNGLAWRADYGLLGVQLSSWLALLTGDHGFYSWLIRLGDWRTEQQGKHLFNQAQTN